MGAEEPGELLLIDRARGASITVAVNALDPSLQLSEAVSAIQVPEGKMAVHPVCLPIPLLYCHSLAQPLALHSILYYIVCTPVPLCTP